MCWSVNATHRSLRTRELAYYLCGLDQHQVRRWRSWYRWTILAMLAYAFLVVAAVTEHARHLSPFGVLALQ